VDISKQFLSVEKPWKALTTLEMESLNYLENSLKT
jgi:hypothetical protein